MLFSNFQPTSFWLSCYVSRLWRIRKQFSTQTFLLMLLLLSMVFVQSRSRGLSLDIWLEILWCLVSHYNIDSTKEYVKKTIKYIFFLNLFVDKFFVAKYYEACKGQNSLMEERFRLNHILTLIIFLNIFFQSLIISWINIISLRLI